MSTRHPAPANEVTADRVRRRCDPDSLTLGAEGTANGELIGQRRAAEALAFGLTMTEGGFNIFASGPPGTGKTTAVRRFLEDSARGQPAPADWCYIHNFAEPARPQVLRLPAGQARRLRDELANLVQAARREIPRAFESEEYIAQREAIVGELEKRRNAGLTNLGARAQLMSFTLQPTPAGLALIPIMGNRPVSDETYAGLPTEMRATFERNRAELDAAVRGFLKEMRAAERATRERLEAQDREVALHAVGGLVEDLVEDYADQPDVSAYLDDVREGILADIALFRAHPLPSDGRLPAPVTGDDPQHALHERALRRYEVNVVVDNGGTVGAPVVVESNPSLPNLVGRIEREAVFGALMTDFTLVGPGALHRANGGYLVLRAEDLLRNALAWDALKRSLREQEIVIEDLGEALGLVSTRGLRPDPIPLAVKVCLLGEPSTYHLLYALDPDFRELFKVRADFDTEMDRTPATEADYANVLAACASASGCPAGRGALARLIEESSRLVADQRKLSARFGEMTDLVRESAYWARLDSAAEIGEQHVRRAVEERRYRTGLARERLQELIGRGVLLVRPTGSAVGQVNGLAVVGAGDTVFGRPSRITATVGAGRDGVLDIERQAELGGRIHSKGVLILGGYLADTYARDKPLALSARLVFEQSYEEVEGDSASLAELLALLSRLAVVPLRQGLAVTGSVNQRGEVQPVGGVNEKVEGFFDACAIDGLTGDQGIVLPAANVENLMLRDDVVEAIRAGRFHVYAVRDVDEALEVLTGFAAGPRRADGTLPREGIHARVDRRLEVLAGALREFGPVVAGHQDGPATAGPRGSGRHSATQGLPGGARRRRPPQPPRPRH